MPAYNVKKRNRSRLKSGNLSQNFDTFVIPNTAGFRQVLCNGTQQNFWFVLEFGSENIYFIGDLKIKFLPSKNILQDDMSCANDAIFKQKLCYRLTPVNCSYLVTYQNSRMLQ